MLKNVLIKKKNIFKMKKISKTKIKRKTRDSRMIIIFEVKL